MRSEDSGHENRVIEPRNYYYRWKFSLLREAGTAAQPQVKP